MQASTSQTQKEKLEGELKQHIKKLQRLRDQIKTWLASNEIKDKSALLENRKLIETQMERFKACEKEMKTKAFSKEGLSAAQKLDPREKEKLEASQWLSAMVEDLQRQIEQTEAEIEALSGGAKKKKTGGDDRQKELDDLNTRRQWHLGRMEIVLRLLENGTLPADKVQALKEDISYFVQSNTEEDFEEDDGIYDDLNLHEEEEKLGMGQDDLQSSHDTESMAEEPTAAQRTPIRDNGMPRKSTVDEESSTGSNKKEESSPTAKKSILLRRMTLEKSEAPKLPPAPNFTAQPMSAAVKSGVPIATAPKPAIPPLPPIRYSAAVAASVPPATPASTAPSVSSAVPPAASVASKAPEPSETSEPSPALPPSPSLTQPSLSAPSPVPSSIPPSQLSRATPPPMSTASYLSSPVSMQIGMSPVQQLRDVDGATDSPSSALSQVPSAAPAPAQVNGPSPLSATNGTSAAQPSLPTSNAAVASPAPPSYVPPQLPLPIPSDRSSPRPPSVQPQFGASTKMNETAARQAPVSRPTSAAAPQQAPPARTTSAASSRYPASLSDLVSSFEAAKGKSLRRMANPEQITRVLDHGFASMPQPKDSERPSYYKPRNTFRTPEYYPQNPPPVLSEPRIYSSADVETLFFAFYYKPGTYQQYLAAQELKRQSWRFHKQYLTWFQRHQEPQAITDEYEQGVYVYFDWENSWCQRKKSDFRFEYRYLSDD
ncbi:hypothetical protein DACRYDRAFT_25076 [Dacryopinax primogenitus]|uniref:General negative regulator of transcription subunit n=1 Tax=Dacryopinax primogenitus (strain DJM 731) TaxID=1858805 RepID=M5FNN8_DACPD|nr:uncharacterized protein DACRYDRAFT_25076 [Dacryopinax primogenitus]EJT97740.1 hypothetical protein DACRYDRAFT_25076 [Dacryopinax primogenitus]